MKESIGHVITDTEAKLFKRFGKAERVDIWYLSSEKDQQDLFKKSDTCGKLWIIKHTEYDQKYRDLLCFLEEDSDEILKNCWSFDEGRKLLLESAQKSLLGHWWQDENDYRIKILAIVLYPEGQEEDFKTIASATAKTFSSLNPLFFEKYPILEFLRGDQVL